MESIPSTRIARYRRCLLPMLQLLELNGSREPSHAAPLTLAPITVIRCRQIHPYQIDAKVALRGAARRIGQSC